MWFSREIWKEGIFCKISLAKPHPASDLCWRRCCSWVWCLYVAARLQSPQPCTYTELWSRFGFAKFLVCLAEPPVSVADWWPRESCVGLEWHSVKAQQVGMSGRLEDQGSALPAGFLTDSSTTPPPYPFIKETWKKEPASCQPGWLLSQLWQVYSICKSKQVSPLSWRYVIIKIILIATPATIAYNLLVFAFSWHGPGWQNKARMCDKFSVRDSSR